MVVDHAISLKINLCDKPLLAVPSEAVSGGAKVAVTDGQDLLETANSAPLPTLSPRHVKELLRVGKHEDISVLRVITCVQPRYPSRKEKGPTGKMIMADSARS